MLKDVKLWIIAFSKDATDKKIRDKGSLLSKSRFFYAYPYSVNKLIEISLKAIILLLALLHFATKPSAQTQPSC